MAIVFHNIPKDNFPQKMVLKRCLKALSEKYGKKVGSLHYVIVGDDELLEMNKTYLGHDYYTDIISFDQSDNPKKLEGDIYISSDRVKENGLKFGNGPTLEYLRVCCHGLLHLCGLKDKTPAEKQKMRASEDEGIALYENLLKEISIKP